MALLVKSSPSAVAGPRPSPELLKKCRLATEDAKFLADIALGEDAPFTWPPQIRYALFSLTHYQISSRICEAAARGEFVNPDHIIRFNVRFVALMVSEGNSTDEDLAGTMWGEARKTCAAKGYPNKWVGIERCGYAMAQAHISGDMRTVFNEVGCGSTRDWDHVFISIIQPSVDEATKYLAITTGRGWLAAAPTASAFGSYIVKLWRNRMRVAADCTQ